MSLAVVNLLLVTIGSWCRLASHPVLGSVHHNLLGTLLELTLKFLVSGCGVGTGNGIDVVLHE